MIKAVAGDLERSTYLQVFFDQDLGPSVGRVVNDISTAITADSKVSSFFSERDLKEKNGAGLSFAVGLRIGFIIY